MYLVRINFYLKNGKNRNYLVDSQEAAAKKLKILLLEIDQSTFDKRNDTYLKLIRWAKGQNNYSSFDEVKIDFSKYSIGEIIVRKIKLEKSKDIDEELALVQDKFIVQDIIE